LLYVFTNMRRKLRKKGMREGPQAVQKRLVSVRLFDGFYGAGHPLK